MTLSPAFHGEIEQASALLRLGRHMAAAMAHYSMAVTLLAGANFIRTATNRQLHEHDGTDIAASGATTVRTTVVRLSASTSTARSLIVIEHRVVPAGSLPRLFLHCTHGPLIHQPPRTLKLRDQA
jgi:hypothetical protein